MGTDHKRAIAECQSLSPRQKAVESQPLALWKVNDIEVLLVRFQPDISVIGDAGRPSGVDPRLVGHGQRNQSNALLSPVIIDPVYDVSVRGMTPQEEQDGHLMTGALESIGQAGVSRTYS